VHSLSEHRHRAAYIRPLDVLRLVEDETGIAPYIAYESLMDLARSWIHHLPLLEFQGGIGSQDGHAAAAPEFVFTRLSALGRLVLTTEAAEVPFPFDLLIGTFHRRGLRPPFHPAKVVDAMRWLTSGARGPQEFVAHLGLPSYATGSRASVDMKALAAGDRCELRLSGRVSDEPGGAIRIDSLPPQSGPSMVLQMLENMRDELADGLDSEYDPYLVSGLRLDESEVWDEKLVLHYETPREDWARYLRAMHNLNDFFHADPVQLAPTVREMAEQGINLAERDSVDAVIDQLAVLNPATA
jgi:hypothetical protein